MKLHLIVEEILKNSDQNDSKGPRNSDKALIVEVLQRMGANLSPHQVQLLKSISMESIRRVRQKLQEGGKYPASPQIKRFRRVKGIVVQQNAPQATPQRMEQLFDDDRYEVKPRDDFWKH